MDKRAITVDPATGRLMLDGQLLDRYDPRLWGRVGRNVLDVNTASGGAYGPEAYDPRYYEPYTEYDGDRGEVTRFRLSEWERRYIEQLRARALEIERGRRASESEGSTEWGAADQDAFDRQWDGLTLAEAMQRRGGNFEPLTDNRFNELALLEGDPLIAQFLEQYGQRAYTDENGNPIEMPDSGNAPATGYMMGYGEPTYGGYEGRDILQDNSRVLRLPDGRYIREAGNLNSGEIAGAQREDETRSRRMRQRGLMMAGAVLGGGLAYNALGAAGAAGGGMDLGAFGGLAPEEAMGLTSADMVGGASGVGATAGGGLVGNAAPALGAVPEVAIPGNLAAETIPAAAPGLAGIPALSGGSSSGGFLSTLGSALSGGGAGLGDVISSGATSLGNAITSNPGTAIRGIAGLGAAIAGSRGGGGGGGSGGGGVGDFGDMLAAQANANRVDINTPTGSRRWSQGQDGRWTVNDSMSPEEQANYENVRTMNAGATDYARQLLARTMARPQRDYFAALPPTSQYFSRWGQ